MMEHRMAKPLPSAKRLNCLFEYLPSGILIFKNRDGDSRFNTRWAGRTVSGTPNGKGYERVRVHGRLAYIHRIVWKMHFDNEPVQVDHINGNRSDNRIENLRPASHAENARHSRRNTSATGMKGVTAARRDGKFEARIKYDGKQRHLGTFDTAEAAASAYDDASRVLHGRFSVTNSDLGLI